MLASLSALVLAVTAASTSVPRVAAAPYTIADAAHDLPSFIIVTSSRPGFHGIDLDTTQAAGPLGALARANRHYVDYLTLNAPSRPLAAEARRGFDLPTVQRNVLARLTADTVYLRALAASVEGMRASRGGAAGRSAVARRSVSANRVMDIATRFFYPDAVLPDGRIESHVCVGINGIIDMQGGRDLPLEAFAYAAVFHDYLSHRYGSNDDYEVAKRLMNGMDLSTDPVVRLQRAQGVMWAVMLRSERLRRALAAEYMQAGSYLPFRIEGRLVSPPSASEG